jgi:hypothetical protein
MSREKHGDVENIEAKQRKKGTRESIYVKARKNQSKNLEIKEKHGRFPGVHGGELVTLGEPPLAQILACRKVIVMVIVIVIVIMVGELVTLCEPPLAQILALRMVIVMVMVMVIVIVKMITVCEFVKLGEAPLAQILAYKVNPFSASTGTKDTRAWV